jgi:hypothetical protein
MNLLGCQTNLRGYFYLLRNRGSRNNASPAGFVVGKPEMSIWRTIPQRTLLVVTCDSHEYITHLNYSIELVCIK